MDSETCPKCGRPRFEDSLDCPFCGVVYDRYRGEPHPGADEAATPRSPSPPSPSAPPAPTQTAGNAAASPVSHLPDVYDGPAPAEPGELYAPPSDGPVEYEETFLTRHLAVSVLVVLVLAVALYGFWQRQMFGLWENLDVARQGYARLTGFRAPDALQDGMLWSLAGRKLVVLEETGVPDDELGLTAIVFHPGSMGGQPEPEALLGGVEERIRKLAVPHEVLRESPVQVHGAPARSRTWRLGNERVTIGRVAALAFRAPDGKTALLVVAGPSTAVSRVMREVVL